MRGTELSGTEIVELLRRRRILRLAAGVGEEIYVVPLAYVWGDGSLYCVTTEGKKTAMLRDNPRVAFQVDDSADTGLLGWTSVTGEGLVELLTGGEEMATARRELLERFADVEGAAALHHAVADRVVWLRIAPLHMTGRRSVLTDEGGGTP